MRRSLVFLGLLFESMTSGYIAVTAADPPPRMRLLVPAYFYPAGKGEKEWERLLAAPEEAGVVAIVNPASGPGKRVDASYTKVLERAKKSKVMLIGYVSTSYGKRKTEEVKANVDQWVRFYPGIQGIFFDEQASGTEQLEQLATLYEHVRKTHELSLVVTNPGTVCDEKYLTRPASDVAASTKDTSSGAASPRPPGRTTSSPTASPPSLTRSQRPTCPSTFARPRTAASAGSTSPMTKEAIPGTNCRRIGKRN